MRVRISVLTAIAVTGLLLGASEVYGQAKAGDLKFTPRVFEAASGEKVDAEFGELMVPENRQKPNKRLVKLAFIRFKSTSANPGSPIVYLAGGPGGAGIGTARGTRFPLFMAMRAVADVIAFDQRGVGFSEPNLFCDEKVGIAPDQPHSWSSLLAVYREQSRVCAKKFRQQGVDLNAYHTNESADDLEDLRKALGARKISLWGISYGTHLALATIRRHQNSIDRVILAGVEGPSHTIKLPSTIQKHLEQIDRMVKADAQLSRQIPSFLSLVKAVLERLEREPVTVEVEDPQTKKNVKVLLNRFAVQFLTVFSFGGDEASLPARYYALSKGDYPSTAQGWLRMTRSRDLGSAMAYMMDCASGISPARRRQVEREKQTTLLSGVIDFPFPDICDAWGSVDAGERFRSPVRSKVPALFISGTFDVRTPPSNAEEVRQGFPNSQHLIIEGAVHSDPLFLSSPKIKDVMLEFMKGEKLSTTRITLKPLVFKQV